MIGLDISDRSVKVVQLSESSPRRLLAHCWQPIPNGVIERGVIQQPSILKKTLSRARKYCRLLSWDDPVTVSVPETQSFLRVTQLPIMDPEEIEEAVPWEVARHIPFGLENVYVDWQPVKSGHKVVEGKQEVLVGAAQKKVVDPLLEVLYELQLDVAALELESQAIVRALVSRELKAHQGLLLVDLGGTATNVVIHDHGTIRFTASLQRGGQDLLKALPAREAKELSFPREEELPEEEAALMAERMRAAQEGLVMEILGIVEFYNSIDEQHEVREILLTGGGANFPGLDRVFLRFFDNVHVQRGNPWVNILPLKSAKKKIPLSLRESVHFSTALGLSLRQVE